ncbi:MAG: D-alanyl-D-alanine carboxypeptidase/D-alanyl-D-alanine-endopeptidase [Gemmatimonadaceae bacterium]
MIGARVSTSRIVHGVARAIRLTLLLGGVACVPRLDPVPVGPRDDVRASIDDLVTAPAFRSAHWGVVIVDPTTGDTLYSRNAGKLFMPASNMKIVTGATAVAQLGPDFRFRTTLVARGAVTGGILHGDLIVAGRGDPTVSDHMRGDAMSVFSALADSLVARGLTRIDGRLVANASAFVGPRLGFGWSWDDADFPYAAGVDAMMLNEGFATLVIHGAARVGETPSVVTHPPRRYPTLRITARTVARAADRVGGSAPRILLSRDTIAGQIVVGGTIGVDDSTSESITYSDPVRPYLASLEEALAGRGIGIDGTQVDTAVRQDTLLSLLSPPLREILPALEKPSQNQIAEVFLRTLGLEKTGVGSADSGRRVVESQLSAWGAASDGFVIRDGSGLSRHNYLTPETIVHVLAGVARDTAFQVFYGSLPIAGVDGTLATRMRGTPAQGNVHAKTGYIDRARSLSGYVTTADGHLLIFSILCNNFTTPVRSVEQVQDAIVSRLALLRRSGPGKK